MNTSPAVAPPVSRWWILFIVHASMIAFAINLQMIPPLLPRLVAGHGLSHTGAGLLMGLFTLPGIFLAIPGGKAADIFGPRSVAIWSLSLLTAGALLMVPPHPGFLYFGRLCAGVGGAVLVVVAPQIIARTFHGRELGLAMGIFNTAVPVGTILAFNLLGYLGGKFGIVIVFTATVSFSMVILTAFYLTYADLGAASSTASGNDLKPEDIRLGTGIWLVSAVWMLFNISILAYFTYAIDHFSSSGLDPSAARFLTSLPMLLSIFLTPVAGIVIHRLKLRWSLAYTGCFISSGAVLLLLTPDTGSVVILSVFLGIGISMVPPAVFTLAGELVPISRAGTGYGLLTATFNLGVFFGIPLVGRARDMTLSYRSSFILMAVVMGLAGAVAIVSSRSLSKKTV